MLSENTKINDSIVQLQPEKPVEVSRRLPLYYLVLAHTHPQQVSRLVARLDEDDVHFFIHVDLKSDLDKFKTAIPQENVSWLSERINCIWGDISIVRATLLLIRAVLQTRREEAMCVLLSGQDYPVKSREHIRDFFSRHKTSIFLDSRPAGQVWSDFQRRINYYKIQHSEEKLDYTLFNRWDVRSYIKLMLKGKLKNLADYDLWRPRNLALPLEFYGGSQWWAMPLQVLGRLDHHIGKHEKVLFEFFQYSLIPDEFFFQSMLSIPEIRADNPITSPVTYVKWDGNKHPQPVVFRTGDELELQSLPETVLFARKFDADIDAYILEKTDREVFRQSLAEE